MPTDEKPTVETESLIKKEAERRSVAGSKLIKRELTGYQKAALFLISLDVESATRIFKELDPFEVERITVEISGMKGISATVSDDVMREFHEMTTAREFVVQGGFDYAQSLLEKSFGNLKAADILDKVKSLTHVHGFAMLRQTDPQQLASFLVKEHPQTIALILSNILPEQTAQVLMEFPEELRTDVSYRIATLGKVAPAILKEIEVVLDEVAQSAMNQSVTTIGGAKSVAAILNKSATVTAKNVLENIEQRDAQLAAEIKRLMFLFEDIVFIDDKGIQRILREVDKKDLALSLKVADNKLRDKVYKNMSERAVDMLKEEIEFMGPVRLRDVEQAQTRIVEVVKQLEEREEIIIARSGGGEELFV